MRLGSLLSGIVDRKHRLRFARRDNDMPIWDVEATDAGNPCTGFIGPNASPVAAIARDCIESAA